MKWLLRSERTTASELRALDAINERRTCADYSAGLSGGVSAAEPLHVKALIWTSPLFEATAHRRIWVDFKRGAAVMWQPSYYQEWRTRMSAVAVLQTPKQKIDYARANGIGYLVDDCRDVEAAGIKPAFRSDRLCVTKVADAPL